MLRTSAARCRPIGLRCRVAGPLRSQTTYDGPPISETNRAEATLKRFWKKVGVEPVGDALTVTLDNRPLKTPSGNTLLLPKEKSLIATLVAAEWEHQRTVLKVHALPMTSLVSRAIDSLVDPATRKEVEASLLAYIDTDTVCFQEDDPPPLVEQQTQHWDPLIDWMRKTYDIEIIIFDSILGNSQPAATKAKLAQILSELDHWELAALERSVHMTKSLIISIALIKKHLTVEAASLAARVEVASQIQRWGEVEDTHDVDYHDTRRQLGSAACLLSPTS